MACLFHESFENNNDAADRKGEPVRKRSRGAVTDSAATLFNEMDLMQSILVAKMSWFATLELLIDRWILIV